MALERKERGGSPFLTIVQGTLMQKSDENNPDAVEREYEDQNGNKKTKWELQYGTVSGKITGIEFKDGDFGEQCIVTLQDVDESYKVAMPTDNRYFTDFAKKLPNINLSQEVSLSPYDFVDKENKQVRGLTVEQNGEKVYSHYYDAEGKKTINGLPQPEKDAVKTYDSDDWKMFFIKEKKFLKKQVQGVEFTKASASNPVAPLPAAGMSEEEDDLPF